MIISQEILPEKNLYYIGGIILFILKEKGNLNLLNIYDSYLEIIREKKLEHVELEMFFLAVDWLYLINAVYRSMEDNTICLAGK